MPSASNKNSAGAPYSDVTNRELPGNLEAEKSVLSACLLKPEISDEICIMLQPGNFKNIFNRYIFEAIFEIVRNGERSEPVAVIDKMKCSGKISQPSDEAYIGQLLQNTNALANVKKHAEIVKRTSIQRDLITAAAEINALAYDAPDSIAEVVGMAEATLFKVTEKRVSSDFQSMAEICTDVKAELEAIQGRRGEFLGVPTGFTDLDKLFNGLRPGDLVVVAARPGVGKTSFALNLATKSAKKGTSVVFFSLEMTKEQLVQRILSSEAGVQLSKLRSGAIGADDWSQINPALTALSALDLSIDDTEGLSILECRAKARRQLRHIDGKKKKGLVVVDYLQLMSPPVARRDGNRAVEVAEISRGLKVLAKELHVPVIALSQLNRGTELRGKKDKRPQLSDLRESGAIEQDADIVIFIDRSMDEEEAMLDNRPALNEAVIQVAKHRNGPTKDITLSFKGEFTRFDDLDHDPSHNFE